MFRAFTSRQLLLRARRAPTITKNKLFFAPNINLLVQQQHSSFATQVKIDKTNSKKKRGDKTKKQQQSPDVMKEREIQQLQQEVRFYHQQGSYENALTASNTLLVTTEEHYGKDHPATASAYNNVGLMHKLLGEYTKARQHYHQALRSYGFILGKDHASYAAALHNLGILCKTQVTLDQDLTAMERLSLTEEAIQHLEEAFTIRQVELGKEHPHTVASQSALGSTIASQLLALQAQQQDTKDTWKPSKMTLQRWEAAQQHLREALQTAMDNPRGTRLEHAPNNITTLSAAAAAQNLAIVLKTRATLSSSPTDESLLEEAKKLYEQALVVRTSLLHEAHPDAVATKYSLAELCAVIGDEDTANLLRKEIMDSYNITEVDDNESVDSHDGDKSK